jgi:hypothetical protein
MRVVVCRRVAGVALALALATAIVVPGCAKQAATVSGSVTYKGQPLKGGVVAFIPEKGATVPAQIGEDGTYTAEGVPVGEVTVTVDTSSLKPPAGFRGGGPPRYEPPPNAPAGTKYKPPDLGSNAKNYVEIPDKYMDPQESGLKFTVKGGKNTYNIPLD